MIGWRKAALVLALLCIPLPAWAQTAEPLQFPPLTGRVVDRAGLLSDAQEAELARKLEALESKTTAQFVVVTLPSLSGRTIEEYGYQLGRHWGIGQAGANNGVLLIVAPNERKVRVEVGYGAEGVLPDAVSSLIIQRAILPKFRASDYAGGILAGADEIIKVLSGAGEEWKTAQRKPDRYDLVDWIVISLFFLPLVLVPLTIFLAFLAVSRDTLRSMKGRKKKKDGFWDSSAPASTSSWDSSSSSSSLSWSSGSDSFSGGGGSFGGGGSSGSW